MDRFGDVVYNLYGSTEVAWATIADARRTCAPRRARAGRPPRGTVVRLYDDAGRRSTGPAETGRIFVGNEMPFEGYTGGGGKDVIDGLMSTGDVGHFDDGGRLFIDGRDDEMIVSGGENVFPREVEDLLADHRGVVGGRRRRRAGRRLRASACGPSSSWSRARSRREEDLKTYVKENLAALQGAARRGLPRRAAAQRDGQGAQADARPRLTPTGAT